MAVYSVIPLLSFIAYVSLAYFALRHRPLRMVHKTFVMYLVGVVIWAGLTFILYNNFFPEWSTILSQFLLISGLFVTVAYYHFLRAFMGKPGGIGLLLGYAMLAIATPFIFQGWLNYQIIGSTDPNAAPNIEYTLIGVGTIGLLTAALVGMAVIGLIKQYRHSSDPLFRNRVAYLLAGLLLMAAFGVTKVLPAVTQYPLSHLGNLGNAVFMILAIVRYNLLDIRIVMRKGLVYIVTGLCLLAIYLGLLFGFLGSLQLHVSYITLIASAGIALLIALVFYPIRDRIQKWTERFVFKETYQYRNMLLTFAERMSNVLDIEEIAETMLTLINKALHISEGTLYLPDSTSGDFVSFYSIPVQDNRSRDIRLVKDNPIVNWLTKEGQPLGIEQIDIIPTLRSLWQKERNQLRQSGIKLFFPIKNRQSLVGILALGQKQNEAYYRSEDLDLVMTMASSAGAVIENAQLYADANARASIDELTGLYNHRCFHERLDGEIARCSRFGDIFSVLMLDLDFFKTYNDIHGHLAGDEILSQLGQNIKNLIRNVDTGFRYGGDEFAVILPRTPLESAQKVAERVRRGMEDQMNTQSIELTCSIGIGSWPTDGVMREDLIRATDAALYYAKQTGRNRICLATDVVVNKVLGTEKSTESNNNILSTIYALAATVDAKDHYTYGHSKKVTGYAIEIAEALGYSQERIATIRTAALLHDIGKIGISDLILQKSGPLTNDDWKPIWAHPDLGVAILKRVDSLKDCLAGVRYHHERYDGKGYPAGLKGENIPLDARILAVADAYDAMTSERPYRRDKFSTEQALDELNRCAGTQFDPKIVKVFIKLKVQELAEEEKAKSLLISGHK